MPVLEIKDLRKSYPGPDGTPTSVIDVPVFAMESGTQLGLAGPSGTGKTTFLHLIAGILAPDSGVVRVDGEELGSMSEARRDRHRARTIGYIFQTFNLLQGFTCLENVLLGMAFGIGQDRGRAVSLLRRVGLEQRLHYRPSQLSTGQQQRVAVARALAGRPKLVLADEPTGNLDPSNARESLALIRGVCTEENAALLLVSHDQEVLSQFDRRASLTEINRVGGGR